MIKKYLPQLVLVAAILQIAVAYFFATQGFFNEETSLRLFIQPAGYVFSIWGLIYLFASFYAIYQVMPTNNNTVLQQNRVYALLLFLGSSVWLYASNLPPTLLWLTVPVLLFMGYVSYKAVTVKAIGSDNRYISNKDFFSYQSLIVYAAWTNIAMFVNIGSMFTQYNIFEPGTIWLCVNIFLLLVVFVWVYRQFTLLYNSFWYGFIAAWALVGVFVANGEDSGSMILAYVAAILTIPFATLCLRRLWKICNSYAVTIKKK